MRGRQTPWQLNDSPFFSYLPLLIFSAVIIIIKLVSCHFPFDVSSVSVVLTLFIL
jgi:hypothetical protein